MEAIIIKQTSPYLFTQITYGTITLQKITPEIWLAQTPWISVFFNSQECVPGSLSMGFMLIS